MEAQAIGGYEAIKDGPFITGYENIKDRSFLVTGGTGTFGHAYADFVLRGGARRVVIFSRDEFKQSEMERKFDDKTNRLRFFLGDVRDVDRLEMALRGIDYVIHAAAIKRIEKAEYDPIEAVRTNIQGTANVITAVLRAAHVHGVVGLSSDKAVAPINLYGATKLTMERLLLAANNLSAGRCWFKVVRYGNIWGSRGSVVEQWKKQLPIVTVTNDDATRFFMKIEEAVRLVALAIPFATGPRLYTPKKLPAYRLSDLAAAAMVKAYSNRGLPWYEKMHEDLGDGQTSDKAPRMTVEELREELKVLGWEFPNV